MDPLLPEMAAFSLIHKDGEILLFDGLGSERTVTNSSQTVTGTATYEGFGQTVATTGSSSNPYMFAATSGYRNDGDAGLMHVGARYYDAQVGRFITRDTDLSQKPYLYCEHDPINAVDPTGHWPTIPDWLKQFVKGSVKVVLIVPAIVWGGEHLYELKVDIDTTDNMRRMINNWQPVNPDQDKSILIPLVT